MKIGYLPTLLILGSCMHAIAVPALATRSKPQIRQSVIERTHASAFARPFSALGRRLKREPTLNGMEARRLRRATLSSKRDQLEISAKKHSHFLWQATALHGALGVGALAVDRILQVTESTWMFRGYDLGPGALALDYGAIWILMSAGFYGLDRARQRFSDARMDALTTRIAALDLELRDKHER